MVQQENLLLKFTDLWVLLKHIFKKKLVFCQFWRSIKRLKFVKFELSNSIFRFKFHIAFFKLIFCSEYYILWITFSKNHFGSLRFTIEKTLFSKITPNFCRPKLEVGWRYFKNYAIRLTKCVRAGTLEKNQNKCSIF